MIGPRRAVAALTLGLVRQTTEGLYLPVCARCPEALHPAGLRSVAYDTLERHTVTAHA